MLYDSLVNAKFFSATKIFPPMGMARQGESEEADYIKSLQGQSQVPVLLNEISEIYRSRFITVNLGEFAGSWQQKRELYPEEFKTVFSEEDLANFKSPLLWIKVELPVNFDRERLENTILYLNCFPAMNLKPNELRYKTKAH
jgi:hypothetical protein